MKELGSLLILTLLIISACKKEPAIEPATKESLPFENNNLKMEIVSTAVPFLNIIDMHFFNETTGLIITNDGIIYKTNDRGITWDLRYKHPTVNQPLFEIFFIDQNIGFVVGGANWCNGSGCNCPGGLVLKTNDGGETWNNIYQITGHIQFDAIAKNNNGDLFIIGNGFSGPLQASAKILKSADNGINWTIVDSTSCKLLDIFFNNNSGFCIGSNPSESARIIRSDYAGEIWTLSESFDSGWPYDIDFSNDIGYTIVGRPSVIYKTNDGGDNWLKNFDSSTFSFYKINFLTATSCLLWGNANYSGGEWGYHYGAVLQTIDAGKSWTETQFKNIGGFMYSNFYSSIDGFVIAGRNLIKVTVK